MAVWSIVRYKPIEGCVDKFLKECHRLERNHPDGENRFSIWTKTDEDEVIQIAARTGIDHLIDVQDYGLDWLDSVDHLLEKDSEGSRTKAISAYEIDELRRIAGKDLFF